MLLTIKLEPLNMNIINNYIESKKNYYQRKSIKNKKIKLIHKMDLLV